MNQKPYTPNASLEIPIGIGLTPEAAVQNERIANAVKFLTITTILWMGAYAFIFVVYASSGFNLMKYAATPLVLAPFILASYVAIIRLSWVLYGMPAAVGTGFSIVIPIILLVVMVNSYSTARRRIKAQGLDFTFWGEISAEPSNKSEKISKTGIVCPECGGSDVKIRSSKRSVIIAAAVSASFIAVATITNFLKARVAWEFLGTLGGLSGLGAMGAVIVTITAALSAMLGKNRCKDCMAVWR